MAKLVIKSIKDLRGVRDTKNISEVSLNISIKNRGDVNNLMSLLHSNVLDLFPERITEIKNNKVKLGVNVYESFKKFCSTEVKFEEVKFEDFITKFLSDQNIKTTNHKTMISLLMIILIEFSEDIYKTSNAVTKDYELQIGDYENIHKMVMKDLKSAKKKFLNDKYITVCSVKLVIDKYFFNIFYRYMKNINSYTELTLHKI
jgi:hypothetical protein